MSRFWRGKTPELILAVLVIVAALGVDLLWVRPQERELGRLLARRAVVEKSALEADRKRLEATALAEYVSGEAEGAAQWLDAYREADPLRILERIRAQARLRRLDLRLGARTETPPFTRTTYFMSVQGSFTQQIRFLQALELAAPLVIVDSFTMGTGLDDPGVTLNLDVSVLTLNPEGRP